MHCIAGINLFNTAVSIIETFIIELYQEMHHNMTFYAFQGPYNNPSRPLNCIGNAPYCKILPFQDLAIVIIGTFSIE